MIIEGVKIELGLIPNPPSPISPHFPPLSPSTGSWFPSSSPSPVNRYLQHATEQLPKDYSLQMENLSVRTGPRSLIGSEFPVKVCHYFNKGFCKHGNNCRYLHAQVFPEVLSPIANDLANDDHIFSPGSIEKLELELTELLKSRRGNPVSIASLPMMYYERYGRGLQAEGYLTESQRHGKAGYSLTKLLARLRTIRLIDRPHGQHSVILAEDVPKYMESRSERSDPGPIVSGSRQIYLTFPAESTFTEEDVSDYFSTFGLVEDVRIPCQQKRMFGFVTFDSSDTGEEHFGQGKSTLCCGARVLVKPYREKPRTGDRKYSEKFESSMYYPLQYADMDSELHMMPRGMETSRLLRKQIMEEQEFAQDLEFETRRLSKLQLARNPLANQLHHGYSLDELKVLEVPTVVHSNYPLDVSNNGSTSDDKPWRAVNNPIDHKSSGLELPDSPFAFPIGSSISTI
ncbi:Zinc finger CCCH domain-containing protein 18 [Vitis vinifera]|uniref:Zinc finger CCCH domain-containing protein 18 n=1 Tax=Vitis vinifera TaxID=29760 RepID=A0A438ERA6_VITVI|nr:Zinc finger CCCH domain-containing protein 18 [Vitis vinifera]